MSQNFKWIDTIQGIVKRTEQNIDRISKGGLETKFIDQSFRRRIPQTPGREGWKFGSSMEVSDIKEDDIEQVKDKVFYLQRRITELENKIIGKFQIDKQIEDRMKDMVFQIVDKSFKNLIDIKLNEIISKEFEKIKMNEIDQKCYEACRKCLQHEMDSSYSDKILQQVMYQCQNYIVQAVSAQKEVYSSSLVDQSSHETIKQELDLINLKLQQFAESQTRRNNRNSKRYKQTKQKIMNVLQSNGVIEAQCESLKQILQKLSSQVFTVEAKVNQIEIIKSKSINLQKPSIQKQKGFNSNPLATFGKDSLSPIKESHIVNSGKGSSSEVDVVSLNDLGPSDTESADMVSPSPSPLNQLFAKHQHLLQKKFRFDEEGK